MIDLYNEVNFYWIFVQHTIIALSPRAPVFLSSAKRATACNASGVTSKFICIR